MTMKPLKVVKTEKDIDADEDEEEDPSLEAFAQKIIEEKMRKIQLGSGNQGESDEELDIEYTDSEDGEDDEIGDGKIEESEQEDFFEGEQLSDVDFGQEQENSEGEEMDSDDEGEEMQQYGSEDGEMEEELPAYEGQKKKNGKKGKKEKSQSNFASYEEFAHLLDGDSDEDKKDNNLNAMISGGKRTFSQAQPHF